MARAKTTPKKAAPKKAAPNLFARAKTKSDASVAPKKKKGTSLPLPTAPLDAEGKVSGENAKLHIAISSLIEASKEEKTAKNKANACKGMLKPPIEAAWLSEMVRNGCMPDTPVTVTNYKGESCTYVLVDKAKQYDLSEEQVADLITELGEATAQNLVVERTLFSFAPDVMAEQVNDEETVADVIGAALSEAIFGCDRLTDEQKESLLTATSKTYLKSNVPQRLVEICGADAGKIGRVLDAAGSAITRYIKA